MHCPGKRPPADCDDEIQTTTVGYQNADAELKEYVDARDGEINQALDEAK